MGLIGRSMEESDKCYICGKLLHAFMTTPILETEDGYAQCCEECADKNFPGWDDEDKEMGED